MRKMLAAFGILFALTSAAYSNTIVIKEDIGGILKDYTKAAKAYARSGVYIVLDGDCQSACTLYFSYVPKSHICATPHSRIGFHAASTGIFVPETDHLDPKTAHLDLKATQKWIKTFPPQMRKWVLDNHVMESDRITFVPVIQLPFIRKCDIIDKEK